MAGFAVAATFDQDAVEGIIIRWRLAEQYVTDLDMDSLPSEHALLALIRQDVPNLLRKNYPVTPGVAMTEVHSVSGCLR
jgi:hypothetical protein